MMLVITTKEGLFYNYDSNTWHKDILKATAYKNFELNILIELIGNQDYDLEIRTTNLTLLHTNYEKKERIDKFLS